jgi:flagellar biogenesis protein FliO
VPNFSEPVTFTFIGVSIALIFAIVGLGIFAVQKFKKEI